MLAGCYLAVGVSASTGLYDTVGGILLVVVPIATVVLGLVLGLVAGTRGRSVASTAILTSSLVAGLTVFLVWVGETVSTSGRPYDTGLLRDFASTGGTDLATYAVNDALGAALVLLVLVPMLTTVLAGVTAMLAGSRRGR